MREFCLLVSFTLCITVCYAQINAKNYVASLQSNKNPFYSGFKGTFSVSDNGAAVYDIPFPVTPGVAGMTPKLSVSYNSNNSTSILGEGWALNGFSIISRSPNTFSTDSSTQAIAFNSEDKLSIDGSRLVSFKKDDIYGSGQTEYRTENNSFKKITIEEVDGAPVDGILYFKVRTKDGLDYYYGTLTDNLVGNCNGIVKTNKIGKRGIPYIWLLTLIRDKNGNWIKFDYDISNSFYKPLKITYGATQNKTPIGQISFSYKDETDASILGWLNQKFIQGEKITITKPLETITSFYLNDKNEKFMVRTYKFYYDYNVFSNKLNIQKIAQWVKQSSATKLIDDSQNSILFEWGKNELNKPEFIDSLVRITKEQVTLSEDYKAAIADFNGDGFPDKLMHKNFGDKVVFYLSFNDTKGGFVHTGKIDTVVTSINSKAKVFTGDFNADGKNDLIYLSNENNSLTMYIYMPQTNAKGEFLGYIEKVKRDVIKLPAIDSKKIFYGFGDFNSDGYSDIMTYFFENKKLKYQPITFGKDTLHINTQKEADQADIPDENFLSQLSDINGDGITDLFFTWTDKNGWFTKSFIFNNSSQLGLGTDKDGKKLSTKYLDFDLVGYSIDTTAPALPVMPISSTIKSGDYSKLGNIMLGDLNKDGNIDIVISNTGNEGWKYYVAIGTGDGQFEFKDERRIGSETFTMNQKSSFGDFNGDGLMDIIVQKTDENGWFKLIAYGNGKGDFSLKNVGDKFTTVVKKNFTYSQRFLTDNVLPYKYNYQYKTLFDSKLTFVNSCRDKENYLCVMSNIRMIFPVETGFYPNTSQQYRPYQNPINDPMKDFIKTDLNFENNVKRIVSADFTGNEFSYIMNPRWPDMPPPYFAKYSMYTKITYGDYWQPYVVDLNGDGISDILLTYPVQPPSDGELNQPKNELEENLFTFSVLNQNTKPGYIQQITHSNKNKIIIKYGSILQNHEPDMPRTELEYPFIPFNNSLYTVSEINVSNGISIDSTQNTKYIYQNGIVALNGRGFIGFEWHKVVNLINYNFTTKNFWTKPEFMTLGILPVKSIQTYINKYSNSISEDHFEYIPARKNLEASFNLYCNRQSSITRDLSNFTTSYSETESEFDNFGNLIHSKIKRGSSGNNEIIKEVTNTYFENLDTHWQSEWLLGRLKSSSVKTTRNGASLERVSMFEYNSVNGQLTKEVSDFGNSKFSVTKEYKINKYGNIDTSIIYPTSNIAASGKRIIITTYTPDNRFVVNSIDAGNYATSKKTEPVQGLLLSTTFAEKGNTNSVVADEIGRFQTIVSPDGTESKTEMRIYNEGEFKNIATHFSLEQNNVSGLPTMAFYNSAGRVVRKVTFDFKDREIISEFEYDINGNLVKESLPHFKNDKINYTLYKYDELNRKVATMLPDGSLVTIKYFGLSDTSINSKGQKVISQKNILGELEKSIDDNGFYVNYSYDLFGRMTSITDKNNSIYSMKYDINGNRIEYRNPNFKKAEISDYNAFNQKISTIDPNGFPKKFEYDKLDRLTLVKAERPDFIERIEYLYIEQSDAQPGKGKIKSIKSYSDDHPIDEEFAYFETGQLKTHTYKYFSLNDRMGLSKGNVFTYSGDKLKDNLQYNYTYDKSQVKTLTYPFTISTTDKKFTVTYNYKSGALVTAAGQVAGGKAFLIWELINSNALGLNTVYKLGDSITTKQSFDETVFNLEKIEYSNSQRTIAGMNYSYDELGNLIFRQDLKTAVLYDSIFYDNLNRVIDVKTKSYETKLDYFENGDIKQKVYGGEYQLDFTYLSNSNKFKQIKLTNPITQKLVDVENDFDYDNYGNLQNTFPFLIAKQNYHIEFNQYNLPFKIDDLRFYYAFDGTKDGIYDYNSHSGIAYLGNLSELTYQFNDDNKGGYLKYQKINIIVNGKVIANYYTNNGKLDFLLKDALNTVIGLADTKGKLLDSLAYDIWGLKRGVKDWTYNWNKIGNELSNPKDKGFLNNISFDGYGLVDFSARLYNPITGRFISVDPITGNSLSNTQFANPYLYGYNNPTVFVDANGKFGFLVVLIAAAYIGGSAAGGSLLPWEWNDNWWKGALVGVVSVAGGYAVAGPAMFTGGMSAGTAILSGAAAGFAGSFTATIVNGGNFSQALENGFKGGIIGGVTAGFTYGIGQSFGNPEALSGNYFAKATLHGLNQGIASEAMGGSFEHGFIAGSFVTLAQPMTQVLGSTPELRTVVSAMIGGTASSLGGGKFANGAISGAMIQIYNDNQPHPCGESKLPFCAKANGGVTMRVHGTTSGSISLSQTLDGNTRAGLSIPWKYGALSGTLSYGTNMDNSSTFSAGVNLTPYLSFNAGCSISDYNSLSLQLRAFNSINFQENIFYNDNWILNNYYSSPTLQNSFQELMNYLQTGGNSFPSGNY